MQNLQDRALGKYVITEEIGRGGMGAVYKARDMELDRIVAIKVLSPYLVGEPRLVQRFMREARLAANLDHPNIVTIYDIGGEGSYYYFAMRYLEGKTLKEYLLEKGSLPLSEALAIVRQLASALDYAHQQNVIHRDVKPGNIIINSAGQVCLTDFGLAKIAENLKLTASGDTIGTLEYMAPEQACGDAGMHSDIYSLGVILYEMLAGRLPFQGNNQATLLYQHLHEPPPPPHRWNPHIPPEVEEVVLKAMAKEPGGRYQTAGEMAQALEEAASKALPTGPVRRPATAPAAAVPQSDRPALRLPNLRLPDLRLPDLRLPNLPPVVRRRPWLIPVGLVVLAAILLAAILLPPLWAPAPEPTPTPTATMTTTPTHPATPSPTLTPSPPPLPAVLTQAEWALYCGVDADGQGGRLVSWKWGQEHPVPWPGLPTHPVVSLLSWSPTGERLALLIAEEGRPNLFTISPDGSNLVRLTDSAVEKSDPAWSSDGLQIAFAYGRQGQRDILLIPASGGAMRNATSSLRDDWAPSWSVDSRYLILASKGDSLTNTEILRLDLVSDRWENLTNDPGEDIFPAVAPTGREIIFLSDRSGDFMLYRMDINGQNVRLLDDQPVWLERACWSPDGTWVAFTRWVDGEVPQILFLDTTTDQIYKGPSGCRRPAWRPRP